MIVAVGALIQTTRLASNSDANLEASTRAYIAVTGARFDGAPKAGLNQRIMIQYENVGIQAADDVSHVWQFSGPFEFEPDAKQMPYIWLQTTKWPPRVEGCIPPEKFSNRRPVYPKAKNEAQVYIFNEPPDFLPQSIIDGRGSFYIFGCFTYRTLGKARSSPYCLYFQPKRGRPVEDGTFEWCPSGGGNPT